MGWGKTKVPPPCIMILITYTSHNGQFKMHFDLTNLAVSSNAVTFWRVLILKWAQHDHKRNKRPAYYRKDIKCNFITGFSLHSQTSPVINKGP